MPPRIVIVGPGRLEFRVIADSMFFDILARKFFKSSILGN
jgi:hypothetical protein